MIIPACRLCPRRCGVRREETGGYCGQGALPVVARAALHHWEEPCISGTAGSGAVFFSGCNLRCTYCQNGPISREGFGQRVTPARLRAIFEELIAQGAHNINLVTPTHFTPVLRQVLEEPLPVPVVWNSGGYDRVEALRTLEGRVQVYLPDLKYGDSALAGALSAASDYPEAAQAAILEMFRQTGPYVLEGGLLKRGVLIRHLILPGQLENTRRVMDWVSGTFRPGEVLFSLMAQYTPQPGAAGLPDRGITAGELRRAVGYMEACGIREGYTQERAAADTMYTPPFDLTGVS